MPDDTKELKGVNASVEVIKLTMALATGTLVFSAELLKEEVVLCPLAKMLLVFSWIMLGISILAGAMAFSRVPVMISESNTPNIQDRLFCRPGMVHHVAFVIGVLILGLAMILILVAKEPKPREKNSPPASLRPPAERPMPSL